MRVCLYICKKYHGKEFDNYNKATFGRSIPETFQQRKVSGS
jgi:hypothetical protein